MSIDSNPTIDSESYDELPYPTFLAVEEFPLNLKALPLHEARPTPNTVPRSGPVKLCAIDLPMEDLSDDEGPVTSSRLRSKSSPSLGADAFDAQPELLTGSIVYRRPLVPEIRGSVSERIVDPQWFLYQDRPQFVDEDGRRPCAQKRGELQFDSCFESGNLACAVQIHEDMYDLILDEDVNGCGGTQWFFFSVRHMRPGQTVTFRIINLGKSRSLYERGQRPLIYCEDKARTRAKRPEDPPWLKSPKAGWKRCGDEVTYSCANMHKDELHELFPRGIVVGTPVRRRDDINLTRSRRGRMLYMLQWRHTFDGPGLAYFATAYPYTFTRLQKVLGVLENDPKRRTHLQRSLLCPTLSGNRVDLVTITDREVKSRKRVIVITARVHPGETNSSMVAEGILDFLTSDSPEAEKLRQNFVWKVIPMLNPDGVINGNYRSNMLGLDLNRRWRCASKNLHPSIWYTKRMIHRLQWEGNQIAVYIDLHGHSRQLDWFCYGCRTNETGSGSALDPMALPSALRLNHSSFNLSNCSFTVANCKDQTARVTVWSELKVAYAYTVEISLAGTSLGGNGKVKNSCLVRHFNCSDHYSMAHAVCRALLYQTKPTGEPGEEDPQATIFEELPDTVKDELQACVTREHVPNSESDGNLSDHEVKQLQKLRKRKKCRRLSGSSSSGAEIRSVRPSFSNPDMSKMRPNMIGCMSSMPPKKDAFGKELRSPSQKMLEFPDAATLEHNNYNQSCSRIVLQRGVRDSRAIRNPYWSGKRRHLSRREGKKEACLVPVIKERKSAEPVRSEEQKRTKRRYVKRCLSSVHVDYYALQGNNFNFVRKDDCGDVERRFVTDAEVKMTKLQQSRNITNNHDNNNNTAHTTRTFELPMDGVKSRGKINLEPHWDFEDPRKNTAEPSMLARLLSRRPYSRSAHVLGNHQSASHEHPEHTQNISRGMDYRRLSLKSRLHRRSVPSVITLHPWPAMGFCRRQK
eukprot:GEMP01004657.1.p1 GENE.GEMP01004657.1~~GEMP01004657.1.p1  ORF type:complete len:972 (+),score=171.86 GEMP01004657.1:210-3125(+)